MLISSSPSSPCTTRACSLWRLRRTAAMRGTHSGPYTPRSWRAARAGFARGPSRLNTVRTPSSRRTAPTCCMARWWRGANRNPIPSLSMHHPTCSGLRSRLTPAASRTSALPERLETERLPCLATLPPAAATTKAAVVEMLKVAAPSPPVPQVSTRCCEVASTGTDKPRMTCAAALISVAVSPLALKPMRNPASCAAAT